MTFHIMVAGVVFLFQLAIATFVASDATKRGRSSSIWFIATLLFGIGAMLIYVILIIPGPEDGRFGLLDQWSGFGGHKFKCEDCGWVYNKEHRAERHTEHTGHTMADLRE